MPSSPWANDLDVARMAADLAARIVAEEKLTPEAALILKGMQSFPFKVPFEVRLVQALINEVMLAHHDRLIRFPDLMRLFLDVITRLDLDRFSEACEAWGERLEMARPTHEPQRFRLMLAILVPGAPQARPAHVLAVGELGRADVLG
jgi:hypothetical protein